MSIEIRSVIYMLLAIINLVIYFAFDKSIVHYIAFCTCLILSEITHKAGE